MKNLLNPYFYRLKNETFAGMVLLSGAVVALLWANSPWDDYYFAISNYHVGIESLHLNLSLNHWAADGLLAIFFFVVGVELKAEFVTGNLRDPRTAAVPMIGAVLGMIGPAAIYVLVQLVFESDAMHGWAIPVATDIAFAVALLGIFGKGLPPAVRTFLLTLAVVDDLLGIIIIAMFYSDGLNFVLLGAALLTVAVFGFLVQKRITHPALLIPIAVTAWAFMHASGVHATVAGVLMGMTVPALRRQGETEALTHRYAHSIAPISAGFVLPIFAFFAAGVNVTETPQGILGVFADPAALGIMLALPIGKLLGIWGGTTLLVKTTKLEFGSGIDHQDIIGTALLAGIGFTVSLLISSLSFDAASPHYGHAKIGVITGSVLGALLGGLALKIRTSNPHRGRRASGSK